MEDLAHSVALGCDVTSALGHCVLASQAVPAHAHLCWPLFSSLSAGPLHIHIAHIPLARPVPRAARCCGVWRGSLLCVGLRPFLVPAELPLLSACAGWG